MGLETSPKLKCLPSFPHTHLLRSYLQAEKVGEAGDLSALEVEIVYGMDIFLRALASNMSDSRRKPK